MIAHEGCVIAHKDFALAGGVFDLTHDVLELTHKAECLNPGEPATVQTSFDGSNVRFTFGIPRGSDGTSGSDGAPGEVSQAQLDNAISGTSNNTNGVSTLDTGFADPDLEALRQKMNEIILNGRR